MLNIEARRVHNVLVIEMNGSLDSPSAGAARERLLNIVEGKDARVLLNLAKLAYVTSAGLRIIVGLVRLLQENRRELTICNAKGVVKEALEMFGVQRLVKIYDIEKEALAAFLA